MQKTHTFGNPPLPAVNPTKQPQTFEKPVPKHNTHLLFKNSFGFHHHS